MKAPRESAGSTVQSSAFLAQPGSIMKVMRMLHAAGAAGLCSTCQLSAMLFAHIGACAQCVNVLCGLSCSSCPVPVDAMAAHPALAALDAPDFEGLDTVEDAASQRQQKRRRLAPPGLFPKRQERGRLVMYLIVLMFNIPCGAFGRCT